MPNKYGSRGFVSRRLGLLALTVVMIGLLAFVAVPLVLQRCGCLAQ